MKSEGQARSGPAVVGIAGDRDPGYLIHYATEDAFAHFPEPLAFEWLPTEKIAREPVTRLARFAGLLIAAGSYRSTDGALAAIRYARERRVPLLGTCGGFQHVVLEYVRNVLGFTDADHEAANPSAPRLAITALACSFVGQHHPVRLISGTLAASIYGATETVEPFFCNYGLNPEYQEMLEQSGVLVSGIGQDGVTRILELTEHPFFLATLFVPQARSTPEHPHPLVAAFVAAVRNRAAAA